MYKGMRRMAHPLILCFSLLLPLKFPREEDVANQYDDTD